MHGELIPDDDWRPRIESVIRQMCDSPPFKHSGRDPLTRAVFQGVDAKYERVPQSTIGDIDRIRDKAIALLQTNEAGEAFRLLNDASPNDASRVLGYDLLFAARVSLMNNPILLTIQKSDRTVARDIANALATIQKHMGDIRLISATDNDNLYFYPNVGIIRSSISYTTSELISRYEEKALSASKKAGRPIASATWIAVVVGAFHRIAFGPPARPWDPSPIWGAVAALIRCTEGISIDGKGAAERARISSRVLLPPHLFS